LDFHGSVPGERAIDAYLPDFVFPRLDRRSSLQVLLMQAFGFDAENVLLTLSPEFSWEGA
jgi:hypothetical protein